MNTNNCPCKLSDAKKREIIEKRYSENEFLKSILARTIEKIKQLRNKVKPENNASKDQKRSKSIYITQTERDI